MAKVFSCECGQRTTEPFMVNGRLMCTLCAEEFSPHLVSRRAAANWKEFTRTNRKVPMRSHAKNWEKLGDEYRS